MKILPVNSANIAANFVVPKVAAQEKAPTRAPNTYTSTPLNAHRNQVAFGRSWEEHKSWGTTLNPDGTVNFKFYTFEDAKKVYVEILKNPKKSDAAESKIWERGMKVERGEHAPDDTSQEVTGISSIDGRSEVIELEKMRDIGGTFHQKWNVKGLKAGQFYRFIVVDKDNVIESVKDPYSTEQKQVTSWSTIHDPKSHKWGDADWMAGKDKALVSRLPKQNGLQPIGALRIMEVNIPTLTEEGTFKAAKKALKEIADKNLANAIEIMPVENCYSAQWGYDGVDKLAINERLGTSDELKELIDYAHQLKLNVIMDMVPNHVGPDGDTLRKAGPYEAGDNDFGSKINYEGPGNRYVRDWMSNAALHWADEYHVDGIRFDMTKPQYMGSDFTLKQINIEMHEHFPHVFTIAEDGEGNRGKITKPLRSEGSHEADLAKIDAQVGRIESGQGIDSLPDVGFDSEWDFVQYSHLKKGIDLSNNFNINYYDGALRGSKSRVRFPISHDEQGNLDGTSGVSKDATRKMGLFYNVHGRDEKERGQRAAMVGQALLELWATGQANKMGKDAWKKAVENLKITRQISDEEVEKAYKWGVERVKFGMGEVYSAPGPKMFFQGYEKGSLNYFKFFRDFTSILYDSEEQIKAARRASTATKGYDTSMDSAYVDSKPGRIKYATEALSTMQKVESYSAALNKVVSENPALQDGYIVNTFVDENSLVHATHSADSQGKRNEIFAIKNFSPDSFPEYKILFPQGKWVEIISNDDEKFAGSGNFVNKKEINSDGVNQSAIKLSSSAISIFKKVGQ